MPFFRRNELMKAVELTNGGAGATVIVHGAAGSGKSRFVTEAASILQHSIAVRVNPAESNRPFSGIVNLLAALPNPRTHHLSRAIASAKDRDSFIVAERVVSCLQDAEDLPELILIDDADVMDSESTSALAVISRRLGGTSVRLVIMVSTFGGRRPFDGLPTLEIGALDHSRIRTLVETETGATPHDAVLEHIETISAAIAGRVVDAAHHLKPAQLTGSSPLPTPLRQGRHVAAAFLEPLEGMDDRMVEAIEYLASTPRMRASDLRSLVGSGVVDELLDRSWVVAADQWVAIRDASARSAIYYQHLDTASRQRIHSFLAEMSDQPVDVAWHAGYLDPSPEHASALRQVAADLLHSGDVALALEYIERSLSLPVSDDTGPELLMLAETLFYRKNTSAAGRLIDIVDRAAPTVPRTRLAMVSLRVRIEYLTSQSILGTLAAEALDRDEHAAPEDATLLTALLAIYCAERWEFKEAESYLARLNDLSVGNDRTATVVGNARIQIAAMQGQTPQLPTAAEIAISVADKSAAVLARLAYGRALTFAGRYHDARDLFALIVGASAESDPLWVSTARFYSIENDRLAGDFHGAFSALADILRMSSGEGAPEPFRLFYEYWYHIEHDADAAANVVLDRLYATLQGRRNPAIAARLDAYLGALALHRDDLSDAVRLLMRARLITAEIEDPQLARVDADLVESLVRSGDESTARTILSDFERRAALAPSRWAELAIERCHAVMAPPPETVRTFERLLAQFGPHDSDYEYAKTLHAYAGALAAANMPAEAGQAASAAASVFRRIGLPRWATRAAAVPVSDLSRSEKAVVDLVVAGRRNREIAATLFISVRAVEARLTGVYRKLNISSRAQLIARFSSTADMG
ncbi:LuxR C-terminal-related transcriptional regulator [Leucobacter sp. PH1c]|uniref:LuxR C-terminal-related transcriptional regulator n=1 Tax=Leucobacter sp. PH1c TaxID=1397278 RepID=UPI0009E04A8F|nr:LuxR C-terminal-related transcriptional regulator [Leucobacter sp. PH1c]